MNTICLHSIEEVRPYAARLEELNRASRQKSPFTTFAYIDTYLRHRSYYPGDADAELWFLLVFDGNKPIGYLPMRRVVNRVWGFKVPKVEFLMQHDVDCPHVVARPEDEDRVSAELYRYLISHGDEWSFLELLQQRPDSAMTPPPRAVDLNAYYARTYPAKETNAVRMRWPNLADYFNALSRKFRQNVRRHVRLLMGEGKLTVVSSMDPKARPYLFELALIVAARSWKTGSWVSMLSHPDRLAHFRDLLAESQPMKLWICIVLLDGFPIAASICGDYENALYDIIDLYDAGLERVAPGTTLRMLIMDHAIQKKYPTVDLLAGYAYYKSRWLTEETATQSGQLYRKGSLPWAKAMVGHYRRRYLPADSERPDYNPARREADEHEGAPARRFEVGPPERRRVASLIEQLAELYVDWMSHEDLTRLMPFDIEKGDREPADQPKKPARPGEVERVEAGK